MDGLNKDKREVIIVHEFRKGELEDLNRGGGTGAAIDAKDISKGKATEIRLLRERRCQRRLCSFTSGKGEKGLCH